MASFFPFHINTLPRTFIQDFGLAKFMSVSEKRETVDKDRHVNLSIGDLGKSLGKKVSSSVSQILHHHDSEETVKERESSKEELNEKKFAIDHRVSSTPALRSERMYDPSTMEDRAKTMKKHAKTKPVDIEMVSTEKSQVLSGQMTCNQGRYVFRARIISHSFARHPTKRSSSFVLLAVRCGWHPR